MHFCVGKSSGVFAVDTDTECTLLGGVGPMQTAQPFDSSGSGVGIRSLADRAARALGKIISAPGRKPVSQLPRSQVDLLHRTIPEVFANLLLIGTDGDEAKWKSACEVDDAQFPGDHFERGAGGETGMISPRLCSLSPCGKLQLRIAKARPA